MLVSLGSLLVFAQGEAQKGPDSIWIFVIPAAAILILYLFMDAPGRKERTRRESMLKNLKKTDRVVTIGGIFGSVVNISADGKEVTLKVDDSTRIKFRRTAISEVLGDEPADAPAKSG